MSLEWQRRTDRSEVLVRTASLISTNPDPDLQRKLTTVLESCKKSAIKEDRAMGLEVDTTRGRSCTMKKT